MKKLIVILIILAMTIGLCSCGYKADTYKYLSYTVPPKYEKCEVSPYPLYSREEYGIYIYIEKSESDDVTVEDMLAEHMESNEYSEITPVEDVNIDGITAKQYYRLHTGSNTVTLNVAFIYGDDLVTLTMWSLHDKICDDALNHFTEFVDSVEIDKE